MATLRGVLLTGAVLGLIGAGSAAAHHGWAGYTDRDVTVTGTVVSVRFGLPHDRMVVQSGDGEEWDVWLAPPGRPHGFGPDSVEIGQTVTLLGDRRPDRTEIKTERLTIGGRVYDIYPDRVPRDRNRGGETQP